MDKDQADNDTLASNEAQDDDTDAAEVPAGQKSPSADAEEIENDPQVDDDKSVSVQEEEEDEEEEGSKSALTVDDASQNSPKANNENNEGNEGDDTPATKKKKKGMPPGSRRGRAPAVKGLTIPFRTVKKAMKLDPDIPIVQNEAAIMTTLAAELFLKTLAADSHAIAKSRGRNTIRYEDVAEARSNDSAMAFLETLLP